MFGETGETSALRKAATGEGRAAEVAWLRLARSRNVGPRSFRRLIDRYRGAAAALEALPDLSAHAGGAYQACSPAQAEREMDAAEAAGARMLRLGAPDYPPLLAETEDAPPFLWALGDPALAARRCVAIVGARNASSLGLRLARRLASDLGARGHVVVSGFARGIDTAAHEKTLETGAVAVLAGGVDHVYPAENAALHDRMREEGLLLSEAPMGLEPQGRHFPRRNRIVSGVSLGVVLIEAAARSGSLITARNALEQGREAMAAPGSPLDPRSAGCNEMIRQGAALIRDADDVEEALAAPRTLLPTAAIAPVRAPQRDVGRASRPERADATPLAARLLGLLGPEAVDGDALLRDAGVTAADGAEALLELELSGEIERRAGNMIARVG